MTRYEIEQEMTNIDNSIYKSSEIIYRKHIADKRKSEKKIHLWWAMFCILIMFIFGGFMHQFKKRVENETVVFTYALLKSDYYFRDSLQSYVDTANCVHIDSASTAKWLNKSKH